MAQNITWVDGTQFSNVPAVELPKTGGGTASFTDVTPTTAVATDVLDGKYFFTAQGVLTLGTATGGTSAISVVDTADPHGGTVRTITAVDISDTTATASDVASGKYFYTANGTKTAGTASGGGGGDDLKNLIDRSITTLNIPSGITIIGSYALYGCTALTSVTIPLGVERIGTYAFSQCTALTSITIPSGVGRIDNYAFLTCTSLASLSLPSTLTVISAGAFQNCRSLTIVTCLGELTTLGNSAFTAASASFSMSLKEVHFPNAKLASLGTAFGSSSTNQTCKLLEFADIGDTAEIKTNAFANCNVFETLVLRRSDAICTLADISAFLNTPMRGYNSLTGTVYVPNALISTYQTASNWKTLYDGGTVTFVAIEGSPYEL